MWQTVRVHRHIVGRTHTEASTSPKLNGFQGVCEASKVKPPFVWIWSCINTPCDASCRFILKLCFFYKECVNLAVDLAGAPGCVCVCPMQSCQQSNHSCRGEYTLRGFSSAGRCWWTSLSGNDWGMEIGRGRDRWMEKKDWSRGIND